MNFNLELKREEEASISLRSLYRKFGYCQYKMSKFEEYDLYTGNKNFLVSDSIITFTDTNGKLMALKPDVTLSIVKNTADIAGGVRKVYYDEHVYRVAKNTHSFREIRQVGLECLGEPDAYCLSEVLSLAADSLQCIAPDAVLDVSHLGIVTGILDEYDVDSARRPAILKCIGEKNRHELAAVCAEVGIPDEGATLLGELTGLYGAPDVVLPQLQTLLNGTPQAVIAEELADIVAPLTATKTVVRLDLSVVGDIRYYNGIVFKPKR